MIGFRMKGDFRRTEEYLKKLKRTKIANILERYGEEGVQALSEATPVDTGLTAASWYYKIKVTATTATIMFCNSNIQNGIPIAIILQHGHATGNGGWVEGRDYINPALQPVFESISERAWKEVTKL